MVPKDKRRSTGEDAGAADFDETVPKEGDAVVSVSDCYLHVDVCLSRLQITCEVEDLSKVTAAATEAGLCKELLSSDVVYTPLEKTADLDDETIRKVKNIVEELEEECDDVLNVWTTLGR